MATSTDNTIVASVLTWASAHASVGTLPVILEDLAADGTDGIMLSSMPGEIVSRYKSGGYVASYPFQIVYRANAPDTQARLDAMALLSDIAASIDDRSTWPEPPEGYEYDAFVVRNLPARRATQANGAEDYQVTFVLTYRKRG